MLENRYIKIPKLKLSNEMSSSNLHLKNQKQVNNKRVDPKKNKSIPCHNSKHYHSKDKGIRFDSADSKKKSVLFNNSVKNKPTKSRDKFYKNKLRDLVFLKDDDNKSKKHLHLRIRTEESPMNVIYNEMEPDSIPQNVQAIEDGNQNPYLHLQEFINTHNTLETNYIADDEPNTDIEKYWENSSKKRLETDEDGFYRPDYYLNNNSNQKIESKKGINKKDFNLHIRSCESTDHLGQEN